MIELNWTILVQMINFLVLMFVLNQILYKPILKIIAERDKKVSEGKLQVKELAEKGAGMVALYNDKLQTARIEAMTAKAAARKQSVAQVNAIIEEARQNAEQAILQVRRQVTDEIAAAKRELEPELASMASTIAEQVLGRKVA